MKREMTPNSIPVPGSLVCVIPSSFSTERIHNKFGLVLGLERMPSVQFHRRNTYFVVLIDGEKTYFALDALDKTIEMINETR